MIVMFGGDESFRLCEGNDDVDDKIDLSRERFSQIFVKGPVQLFMFQLVPDINNLDLFLDFFLFLENNRVMSFFMVNLSHDS